MHSLGFRKPGGNNNGIPSDSNYIKGIKVD